MDAVDSLIEQFKVALNALSPLSAGQCVSRTYPVHSGITREDGERIREALMRAGHRTTVTYTGQQIMITVEREV